jgi:hypothetical protein
MMNSTSNPYGLESYTSIHPFMFPKEGAELSYRRWQTERAPHLTRQADWLRYHTLPYGLGFMAKVTGMDGDQISKDGIYLSFELEL